MLSKEQEYFDTHKEELRKKYLNKRVIIANDEVKGAFDTDTEALKEALKTMAPGTFIIKIVKANDDDYVQRFTSRVYV